MAHGLKLAAILALAGNCPERPKVSAVEVVPHSVVVARDVTPTTFELEARVWQEGLEERLSIKEEGGPAVKWKITPATWLVPDGQSGYRARFKVVPNATIAGPVVVTAEAGGKISAGAQISGAPTGLTGQDVLRAKYTQGKAPDAVVVNGIWNTMGAPCQVTTIPFVERSLLGQLVQNCPSAEARWDAAVLSLDDRLTFVSEQWDAPPLDDTPDARPHQDMPRSLPVAVHVMIGDAQLDPTELEKLRTRFVADAEDDVKLANDLLAKNRAGLVLVPEPTERIDMPDIVEVDGCRSGDPTTGIHDKTGMLNVYYVNALPGYHGKACTWVEGRLQDVIYINAEDHVPTTLTHELGHTLGLVLPAAGHTEIVGGLDRSNLMTDGPEDNDPDGRRRLTVGQLFRINADSASWLNRAPDGAAGLLREASAPRLACQCGEADPTGPCPRLSDDVAVPSPRVNGIKSWNCFDQLQLKKVPMGAEDPVAVVAGRRWRDRPGACRTDVTGRMRNHDNSTYIAFDNLDRPGTCDAWAAIFFREHGLLRVTLTEPGTNWTQAAGKVLLMQEMVEPIEVVVKVYGAPAQAVLESDTVHANQTFGMANWSGIVLRFEEEPAAATCQTPTAPRTLSLCYDSGVPGEGDSPQPGVAKVSVSQRKETTVSHYLGQALSLGAFSSTQTGYPDNIMLSDPTKRKQRLTLGQVYRLNAFLEPAFPCTAGTCPTLDADVDR